MEAFFDSAGFWAGLGVFAIVAVTIVDFVFREMLIRREIEQQRYPHRLASELPRVLHKADHDEVLEMTTK